MRRYAIPLLALALFACRDDAQLTDPAAQAVDPALQAVSVGAQAEQVMPGELVVKLKDGVEPAAVAGAHGLAIAGRGYANAFVVMRGAVGSERALAARVAADERVVYAEPNYLRQPHAIDNRLWAFYNPGGLSVTYTRGGSSGQVVGSYLSVNDADEDNIEGFGAGGSAVVIGSIDTGVDFTHGQFLQGQLIAGKDWYDNDNDPSDSDNHGTHTTGTMAGRTVGVAGVSGAGAQVNVYVQRVCGPRGCPLSAIANAIRAAADQPRMVAMNLSLGGSSLSQGEADAIDYAKSKNVLVIASAGNGSTGTVSCPACDPDAISVAATDWLDQHAYYTNWGTGLDISAPGGELYSNTTEEAGIYSAIRGGAYAYYQGTSMAAPQVTGAAAVVASKTGLRGSGLRSRLEGTTDDLGASGYDTSFGHGRLNVYRAVTGNPLLAANDPGSSTTPPDDGNGNGDGTGGETLAASFTYSCSKTTCTFDGSGSTGQTSYAWDFGHAGVTADTETARYTYPDANASYTVQLTVGDGTTNRSTSQTISCSAKGKNFHCR